MGNRPYGPPGVGIKFFKRFYFVFYVIIKIINMAAFFHLDTSITPTTVLSSTPAYINCVVVMRVLVDHHCLRAWEALVESDLGCRKSFQLTSVRCKEMTLYSLAWWWH